MPSWRLPPTRRPSPPRRGRARGPRADRLHRKRGTSMETVKIGSHAPWPPARMIADRAAFIRAKTRLRPAPHAPEIGLHLADEATSSGSGPRRSSARSACRRRSGPSPGPAARRWPATCWTIPRACAARRVLDFASGSGLVRHRGGAGRRGRGDGRATSTPSRRGDRRSTPPRTASPSRPSRADLVGADRRLGHGARRRHLLRARPRRPGRRLALAAARPRRRGADRRSRPHLSAEGAARSGSPPTTSR